jgi:hypothetical protein
MPPVVLRSAATLALTLALLITGCGGQPTPTPAPVVVSNIHSRVNMPAGYVQTIHLDLQAGQRVEGTLTVRSTYSVDIPNVTVSFLAEDPSGRVAVNASRVNGVQAFSLVAADTGRYNLVLDNSHSLIIPAAVEIVAEVWSR